MSGTMAEQILARKSSNAKVTPGDYVVCSVDVAMSNDTNTPRVLSAFEEMGAEEVWDESRIILVMDHIAPSHTVTDANQKIGIRQFAERQGIDAFYDVGSGISHEVLPEKGHVRPGELVVGADSHTTSMGAFGAAGTGVGGIDMAYLFATGRIWFRVPKTIKISVEGTFRDRVSPKDLVLYLAGTYGTDVARYKSIEYEGRAVEELALDRRFVLANMGIELGAKFAFTPVDADVIDYVESRTEIPFEPVHPDADAEYEREIVVDVSELEPMVSLPHRVENVAPISTVEGTNVDQVFIGSCTNGKYDDLRVTAEMLDGRTVDANTRLVITPASREIFARAERSGLLKIFNDAGAIVTNPTCGACIGRGLGVLGDGEVCLAAQNRNFRGRMGSNDSEIYLASPESATASAINGHITDPRDGRR